MTNAAYLRDWKRANPERVREYAQREYSRYPEKVKKRRRENASRWRRIYPDRYAAAKAVLKWRRFARRLMLIQEHGGHCVRCGEDNPLLLQFDHRDPTTKERVAGVKKRQSICNGNIERMRRLAEGCQLLCANCHVLKTWYEQDYAK